MRKLDFIIVGAMKAGTSSLAFQLRNNPQVFIPLEEIHFFDNEENFSKGVKWYENIFKNCSVDSIIGEKTPTYSYSKKVPQRIFEYNPDIKLVWIFRNPVDRAYSNYLHAIKSGSENLSFEEAIKLESKRIAQDVFKGYLKRSIYIEQVERYLNFFDLKNMHLLLFEDFVKNPTETMSELFKFLEVSFNNYQYKDEIRNITLIPRIPKLLRRTRKVFGENSLVYRGVQFIAFKGKEPGYAKLSKELRAELTEYFVNHNEKLRDLTGLNTKIWEK
ncbi:MAG: sulfotransferase domain-containing protein [Candidatus Heimdallarchaeota archaeon]|nr:sulfotransferase domain-containing protein [Candidatus Heimdallarchaeota archaeon]MCK4769250.1 sulfotransferase domain-containing protein [Candidatus Heimdallarchaeota archaeon]MCK5159533.1 sulfotransferase domain-containing protein [Candidatus Heimdallarchaeota archaeon]